MNQNEGSAESSGGAGGGGQGGGAGDGRGGGGGPGGRSRGGRRSPARLLPWVAMVVAVVVAAICWNTGDDPGATETLGQPATGEVGDCYTTEADRPHPRDTNRYVVALTADDADAGALDEYAHCKHQPVKNPATADPGCYSTGDDNEWHLTGVNLYALALLKAGASAGALDKYAHCAYLPAVLAATGSG